MNGYIDFIFREGLPDGYGVYLFALEFGEFKSGYYNHQKGDTEATVEFINESGLLEKILESSIKGYLTSHNSIIKGLPDYPSLIADLEQDYYQDQQTKKAVQERIALFNAELELDIAKTPELRNEGMRKAMKTKTQLESEEYLELQAELEKAESRERSSLITLERHKREYSVLKLEKEEAIARFSLAEAK